MKMYESVLARVKILEQKNGIKYADTKGKLYKTLKVLFVIFFVYSMCMNSLYFLGALVATQLQLDVVTPAICTALVVTGFVLVLCKQHIIGTAAIIPSSAVLLFTFGRMLIDDLTGNIIFKFYWAHLIPLGMVVILSVWMTVIALRANIKLKKMYNRVAENIYNTYKINVAGGEDVDEEKWNEFLANFDPNNYNSQFVANEEASE